MVGPLLLFCFSIQFFCFLFLFVCLSFVSWSVKFLIHLSVWWSIQFMLFLLACWSSRYDPYRSPVRTVLTHPYLITHKFIYRMVRRSLLWTIDLPFVSVDLLTLTVGQHKNQTLYHDKRILYLYKTKLCCDHIVVKRKNYLHIMYWHST